jgi:soluble lytic murein transglycosylase-like protein
MTPPTRARRRALRAVLGALAGGGLTAASLASPAVTSEAFASNIGGVPTTPEVTAPESPGEATSPATATGNTTTTPAPATPSTGTTTTPQPPAPKQEAPPAVSLQRRQRTSGGAKSSPANSNATGKGKAKAGQGPNNVAGSPQEVAKAGALAAVLASSQASTQSLSFYRVPLFLLPIYKAAAVQYGVPWQILAGINEIETDYGADQSVSSAGALGWMQFMPETWSMYGVDALEAGYADPYNPVDAVFAAARYLRAAGAATDLRRAILAYNHSEEYVDSVMLRAKLISTYPKDVIATLTGLVDGLPPVNGNSLEWSAAHAEAGLSSSSATANAAAAKSQAQQTAGTGTAVSPAAAAAAAAHAQPAPKLQVVDLTSAPKASVVAVQDGRIVQMGNSRRLGRYIVLRDVYGDVFTYAGLGSIAPSYTRAKPAKASGSSVVKAASTRDPAPSKAATAGSQAPVTLQVKTPAPQNHGSGGGRAEISAPEDVPAGMNRPRLFALPGNPDAKASAAVASARRAARAKAAQRLPLRKGSVVPSGTVLGTVWTGHGGHAGHLRFAVKPAGDSASIDPGPVLANWAELQKALHPQGARAANALLGATASDVFLLSRAQLERTVLSDPGITVTGCSRQDVASGAIDRRVLAVLAFLSRSGLKPTVGALRCGQSQYSSSGAPSPHYRGDAVDITAINGVPLARHQGPGTITDLTIRALLTLPSEFVPHEILSLMHYPASPQTKAVSSHWNKVELVFGRPAARLLATPTPGSAAHSAAKGKAAPAPVVSTSILSPLQWSQLVTRIGAIPAPKIVHKPSSAAISDQSGPAKK